MGTTKKTLLLFLRENLAQPKLFWTTAILWPIGIGLQNIALPLIVALAIGKLVTVAGTNTNYVAIFWPYLATLAVVGVLGQVFAATGMFGLSKLETVVRPKLQNKVFERLMNQSLDFHANTFSGSLVSQTNRFTAAYVGITDVFFLNIVELFVKFVVAIIVIAFFSPLIALAMFAWSLVFMVINYTLTKKRMHLSKIAAVADTVLTGHLADTTGNIGVIKAFAREDSEAALHNDLAQDRALKKYAAWQRAVKNGTVTGTMMLILQIIVLVLSIYAISQNSIDIGILLLIQVYIAHLIGVLWSFGGITRNLEQFLSDSAEMTEILGQAPSVTDVSKPKKLRVTHGAIQFSDVFFNHPDTAQKDILFKDFSLSIAPGEKVGLVGHSGSGKTTLTKLLLRFADIQDGAITIDGQNIAEVAQADLRANIAYVPQEPLLFHRTIRENIAYGKPNATDAEIHAAAKKAHAAEFIEQLPKGYQTTVGERGVKLSGGQRQRIAIARAIVKDAPILVLDEATSALDSESEKLIQDALKKLMQGRTTIVIAHRLSTIQKMDRIVVLANGTIVEQGSHTQLLSQPNIYADLWKHQSGGFLEE